jgi:hypothetical protein
MRRISSPTPAATSPPSANHRSTFDVLRPLVMRPTVAAVTRMRKRSNAGLGDTGGHLHGSDVQVIDDAAAGIGGCLVSDQHVDVHDQTRSDDLVEVRSSLRRPVHVRYNDLKAARTPKAGRLTYPRGGLSTGLRRAA